MKEIDENSILESLSGNNEPILEYLPYILQDLWELGGGKEEMITILKNNFNNEIKNFNVLDLCCGKGANLIVLASVLGCKGLGIDLFEPFISEANKMAKIFNVTKLVDFVVSDIRDAINQYNEYDLILYGNDTNVLGNEETTIKSVLSCCKKNGFLLYHTAGYTCATKFHLIDSMSISIGRKREINTYNNNCIKNRCYELIEKYPDKKDMFNNYVAFQEKESEELINNMDWSYYLIQNSI